MTILALRSADQDAATARPPRGGRSAASWRRPAAAGLLATAALALAPLAGAHADSDTTVNLRPASTSITFGAPLAVGGTISHGGAPIAGAAVQLQLDRYPYDGYVAIASARSGADGSFAFTGVRPSRNSRLRVVETGGAQAHSADVPVTVNPAVQLASHVLARGRTLLRATAVHTKAYGSPAVDAYWYVALRGSFTFTLVAVTRTREAAPGVTTMSATIDPPAKRFSYVVCFVPAWARAMGPPSARLPCRDHDFVAEHPQGAQ